jgi:hypothetical protein
MRIPLLLASLLIAAQSQGQDVPKGVVEGTVLNEVTGEPVRRASVVLSGQAAGTTQEKALVQTQADGQFRFEGLAPGSYFLYANKNGFLTPRDRGGVSPIQLTAGGQKTGLTLKLTPQGIISGSVFDEEGDPVQGAQVQVLQRRKAAGKLRWQPANGGATNDRGEYRLPGLAAGEYAVLATYRDPMAQMNALALARPQVYATTYYPNGADVNSAQAITVQKGGETAGIDFRLRKEAAFRVRVKVDGVPPELLQQTSVNVFPRDSQEGYGRGVSGNRQVEPGLFELMGVRAGSWSVMAQVFQQGGEPLSGVTSIEVTTADVSDVVVRVGAGQLITGTFAFEGTPTVKMNWKSYNLRLVPAEGGSYGGYGSGRPTVNEDGSFTLRNNMPGKYLLAVQGPSPERTYLASIRIGAEEYFGKEIDLTSGAPGPLKIVYRNDPATVTGNLEGGSDGAAAQPAMVVLAPAEPHLRRMEYMSTAQVRPDGSFTVSQVRPGEYLACHMLGDYRTLAEEGEPPKESMDAAVRLKVEPNGAHTVQVKAVKAAPLQ